MAIRAFHAFLIVTSLTLITACDSDTPGQANSALLGTWTCRQGPLVTRFQFRPDGSCTRSLAVPTGPEKTTGTWNIDDDGVTLELSLSNGGPDPDLERHSVHVDGSKMFFTDEKGMPAFIRDN